jgi:CBS domain-containing protein
LFTIGGGIGSLLGSLALFIMPELALDVHVAALVGMAAMFAGASHALLASIVFTFEITRQSMELLPLLAGCSAAYLVSLLLMRSSIMTEKLARRGTFVRTEYTADYLDRVLVRDAASTDIVAISDDQSLGEIREWLATRAAETSHQGFPVLDGDGQLLGVVTRRDLVDISRDGATSVRALVHRPPVVVYGDNTLREAADHMVHARVGRLPVVERGAPRKVVGMISRSDLLSAHQHRLDAALVTEAPPIGRGWLRRQQRRIRRVGRT